MKVVISPSTNSKKKYMAVFTDSPSFKKKTIHFGSAGMKNVNKDILIDIVKMKIGIHRPQQGPCLDGCSGINQH